MSIRYIKPGQPNQNAYVERFNRMYREEFLSLYLFRNLNEVREGTHAWKIDYNEHRPHGALGDRMPDEYRQNNAGDSTLNSLHNGKLTMTSHATVSKARMVWPITSHIIPPDIRLPIYKEAGMAPSLTQSPTFKSISMASPPPELTMAFDTTVQSYMELILARLKESVTLAAIRDALLPKLISGELRVPNAEKFLEVV